MNGLRRRQFLQISGVTVTASLAGCGAVGRTEPPQRWVEELGVSNLHSETHTVSVLLLRDGEPVYWRSMETEPYNEEEQRAGGGRFEGYPTEPGPYVLYVRLDSQPRSMWKRFTLADHDHECLELEIHVGDDRDIGEQSSEPPELHLLVADQCDDD